MSLHALLESWKEEQVEQVPLRVIVLQSDLQFNRLGEVTLLFLRRIGEEVLDVLSDVGHRNFTSNSQYCLDRGDGIDTSWLNEMVSRTVDLLVETESGDDGGIEQSQTLIPCMYSVNPDCAFKLWSLARGLA